MGSILMGVGGGLFFTGGLMAGIWLDTSGHERKAIPGIVMFAIGVIMMVAVFILKLPVHI